MAIGSSAEACVMGNATEGAGSPISHVKDGSAPVGVASDAKGSGTLGGQVCSLAVPAEPRPCVQDVHDPSSIIHACREGDQDVVNGWIALHGSPDGVVDRHGSSGLHYAAGFGHLGIVELLLDAAAATDFRNRDSRTALMWACLNGHLDVARLLKDRGADVRAVNKRGVNCLHWAVYGQRVHMAEWLTEQVPAIPLESLNDSGCSAVLWACSSRSGNCIGMCNWLLQHNADFLIFNDWGHGALVKAAWRDNVSLLEWLLRDARLPQEHLFLSDRDGRLPSELAAQNGSAGAFAWLSARMAEAPMKVRPAPTAAAPLGGLKVLHSRTAEACGRAVCNARTAAALLGVYEGASPEEVAAAFRRRAAQLHPDRRLHDECKAAHAEFQVLVQARNFLAAAAPKVCNVRVDSAAHAAPKHHSRSAPQPGLGDGGAPDGSLLAAVETGDLSAVRCYLQIGDHAGAGNIAARQEQSSLLAAALGRAADSGHVSIVDALLAAAAELTSADGSRATPLLLACRRGHVAVTELLLERHADPASRDRRGACALLSAVDAGAIGVCELLLSRGLRLASARCRAQAGAAAWAAHAGDLHMCRWLAAQRADFSEADAEGRTPLHHAAWHGVELEVAEWLLAAAGGQRQLLRRDRKGRSPAELAAAKALARRAGPRSRQGRLAAWLAAQAAKAAAEAPAALAEARERTSSALSCS